MAARPEARDDTALSSGRDAEQSGAGDGSCLNEVFLALTHGAA